MSKFVGKSRVEIKDDEGNTIWIKALMPFGAKQRVMGHASQMISRDGDTFSIEANLGLLNLDLLIENIVDWSGEAFTEDGKLVPVSARAIGDLEDFPLLDLVLAEIQKRNKLFQKKDPDAIPNSVDSGSPV